LKTGIEQIRRDAAEGRYESIAALAHKLIAATGSMGLMQVSKLCTELQDRADEAKAGDTGDLTAARFAVDLPKKKMVLATAAPGMN